MREKPIEYVQEDGAKFAYIMDYFRDLSACRGVGMSGGLALTHQEILAWCTLTQTKLTRLELAVLRQLDRVFLEGLNSDDSA